MKHHETWNPGRVRRELAEARAEINQLREQLENSRELAPSHIYQARIGSQIVPLMLSSINIRHCAKAETLTGMEIVEIESGKIVGEFVFDQPIHVAAGGEFNLNVELRPTALLA